MKFSRSFFRRLLMVCAAVIVCIAVVLAGGVIQPVKAEVSRGSTPEKAVLAFWVNIGMSLLSALALLVMAMRSNGPGWISKSGLIVVGLIVMFLGFALFDAGSAYRSHGPAMQSASTLLFVCAAVDFLAGALVVAATAFSPKKTGTA